MAPAGAIRRLVTPGLDPMARITGILLSFLLIISVLPYTSSLPTRTEKLISVDDRYYWVDGQNGRIACLLCDAGTFVKEDCTIQYSAGKCEFCRAGTFSEFSSGLDDCLPCSRCRDDQVEVTPCSRTKDTVCLCKKGTFCPPGQPCEICLPCTTSCPENEVINAPCNSTSDILCTAPDSSNDTRNNIIASVVGSLFFIIIIIVIIIGVCQCRKRRNTNTGSKLFGKLTVHICKGNKDHDEAQGTLLARHLKLKEGIDRDTKEEIISKSCAIIVRLVPVKDFEILMLHLGLSHNEIYRAKAENQNNVNGQSSAMLMAWYQSKDFDINSLLKALRDQNMETIANDIADLLLKDELYVLQTDHNA